MSGADPGAAAWHAAVAACLVGTERAGPGAASGLALGAAPGAAWPAELGDLAAGNDPGGLLAAVAALGVWRMAGRVPDPAGAVPLDPVEDTVPECGQAAAERLERLLADTGWNAALRGEWCRLAAAAGVRAPAGLAPRLLRASRNTDWREDADRVLGARRHWLRGLDGTKPVSDPGPEDWTGPDLARRVAALRLMREQDPAAARDALVAVWNAEAADARAALLAALRAGLSDADEAFLEDRLDDRAASVRAEAARLLEHLPGSRLAARMQERARAAVRRPPDEAPAGAVRVALRAVARALPGAKAIALEVVLPQLDPAARRDGLEVKGTQAGQGAALLGRIVAAAPLASWGDHAPEVWVSAALAGEWAAALLPGWARAAAREGSAPWLAAVMDALMPLRAASKLTPEANAAFETAAAALPPAELERAVMPHLQGRDPAPAHGLLPLCRHDWSPGFTAAVAAWVARSFGPGGPYHGEGARRGYGVTLTPLALHADPDAAAASLAALQAGLPEELVPHLRRTVDAAVETLRFRAGMKQEFTAP